MFCNERYSSLSSGLTIKSSHLRKFYVRNTCINLCPILCPHPTQTLSSQNSNANKSHLTQVTCHNISNISFVQVTSI